MRFRRGGVRGAVLVIAAGVAGCGGSATAPSQTVTSLSIRVPSDVFIAGTNAALTPVETLAGGGTALPVAAQWASDDPSVATVDPLTGALTAMKNGTTAIHLSADGLTTSTSVRVVPKFQGTWSGTAAWRGCKSTGVGRTTVCSQGTSINLTLSLTQNGETVQGTLSPGFIVAGSIDSGGVLTLVNTAGWVGTNYTSTLTTWTSSVSGTQMTGSFSTHSETTSGPAGTGDNAWELTNVVGQ